MVKYKLDTYLLKESSPSLLIFIIIIIILAMMCGMWEYVILVSPPGVEPVPPAVEAWCLSHWTSRAVRALGFKKLYLLIWLHRVLVVACEI